MLYPHPAVEFDYIRSDLEPVPLEGDEEIALRFLWDFMPKRIWMSSLSGRHQTPLGLIAIMKVYELIERIYYHIESGHMDNAAGSVCQ